MFMIKEYLGIIKAALAIMLLVGLFIGGCSYGTGKKEAQVNELQEKVRTLQEANRGFIEIEEERAKEIRLAQKRAEEWREAANAAAERVSYAEDARRKAEAIANKAMDRARADPTCAELLRRNVCDAVPLP